MACTSPPTPKTHAQLAQGWEHTGMQGQMPADQTMPPSATQNRPGCPGQVGLHPFPSPSFRVPRQLSAGGAGTGSCQTRSGRVGSLQRQELLPCEQGEGDAALHRA